MQVYFEETQNVFLSLVQEHLHVFTPPVFFFFVVMAVGVTTLTIKLNNVSEGIPWYETFIWK